MAKFRVTTPDGKVFDVTAPEGATEADVLAAVRANEKISAPSTIRDYIVSGLRQVGEDALPILGLTAGGALGAAAGGPAGAVGGAGLGYAAGRQANRAIGSVARYTMATPEAAPTIPSMATTLGSEALTGAGLEAGSAGLIGAGRVLTGPIKALLGISAATPEDLAIRDAAERLGIPISAATASGSTPVSLIESVPARFPLGRQTAEKAAQRTQAGAQAAAENLQGQIGPARSLEQAGQSIQRDVGAIAKAQENAPTELIDRLMDNIGTSRMGNLALGGSLKAGGKAVEQSRRAEATRLYEEALSAGGRTTEIPMQTTNRMASEMLAAEQRLGGTSPSQIAARAAGLKGATEPPPILVGGQAINPQNLPVAFLQQHGLDTGTRTLEEAVSIQQRLASLIRNTTDDYTRRQLRQLFGAVSQDIQNFAGASGGEFGQKLAAASTFYRDEVASYFARRSPLRKLFDKEPGAVADNVLTSRSPDQIKALMAVLPDQQKNEFRRQVVEQMKARSLDVRTGEVNPQLFLGELTKFGDENMTLLMGSRVRGIDALKKTLISNFGPGTANADLAKVVTANPEQIVNSFARGRLKSVDDFETLWRNISPTTQGEARGALFNEVLTNSFDPTTGRFSIDRFLREKERIPEPIWDRMLAANPKASLDDMERVFRRIGYFSKVAANPSQTSGAILGPSQVLGMAALGASTAFGREDPQSFSLKLFTLLSPVALGALVFSRGGQRLLTSQPRLPINLQGPAATALKIGGAQALQIQNPQLQELLK